MIAHFEGGPAGGEAREVEAAPYVVRVPFVEGGRNRTAATRLHREGMPIAEISRILGHADIKTTYRYIGVDETTTERAADIFDLIEEKRQRRGRSAA